MSLPGADISGVIRMAEGWRNREPAGWHPVHRDGAVPRASAARTKIEPAATIDRLCSSAPQARQSAASEVMSGTKVIVVTADAECAATRVHVRLASGWRHRPQTVREGDAKVMIVGAW